jgi:hypothetical protein
LRVYHYRSLSDAFRLFPDAAAQTARTRKKYILKHTVANE